MPFQIRLTGRTWYKCWQHSSHHKEKVMSRLGIDHTSIPPPPPPPPTLSFLYFICGQLLGAVAMHSKQPNSKQDHTFLFFWQGRKERNLNYEGPSLNQGSTRICESELTLGRQFEAHVSNLSVQNHPVNFSHHSLHRPPPVLLKLLKILFLLL